MTEYRTDWNWKKWRIDEMSKEHLVKAINVITYRYDDRLLEYLAAGDEEGAEEFSKTIKNQLEAMQTELALKIIKDYFTKWD